MDMLEVDANKDRISKTVFMKLLVIPTSKPALEL